MEDAPAFGEGDSGIAVTEAVFLELVRLNLLLSERFDNAYSGQ
jgi:hypothetical protein